MDRTRLKAAGVIAFAATGLVLACSHVEQAPDREIASTLRLSSPSIKYYTYSSAGVPISAELITPERWNSKFQGNSRYDYLAKLYYANTREKSNTGKLHYACYEGPGSEVRRLFFGASSPIDHVALSSVKVSADEKLMGLQFQVNDPRVSKKTLPFHFRMPNCESGKMPMSTLPVRDAVTGEVAMTKFMAPKFTAPPRRRLASDDSSEDGNGFTISDQVTDPAGAKLPRFQLRADYDRIKVGASDRPWKGMDIRDPKEALRFALMLQKYAYEGMVNQSTDPDSNLISTKNPIRDWCNMPWLQVGPSGREAIHGLTKERDLAVSPLIGGIYSAPQPGADWGVAYFNAAACKTIGDVFGTPSNAKVDPDWSKAVFDDGAVAVKYLFTTSSSFQGAFSWNGNLSIPGDNSRKVRPAYHIQMDIAVRDSTLKGVRDSLDDWVMLTYYFDPSYDYLKDPAAQGVENPLKNLAGLPEGFKHMRPMGVQSGFDTADSVVITGSKTNGAGGRLNGPADNPKSSCLSCHGTAGTSVPMAPGFMSNDEFTKHGLTGTLDFSQQFALAKRNSETKPSQN